MPTKRSPHDRLLLLQKKIYRSLREQSDRLLGETPEAIRRYEREYRDDFRGIARKPNAIPKDDLIAEIRKTDVCFVADFHTFSQAQRTALRILRECVRPDETWYLGLEIFSSHRQSFIDRYLAGEISEEKFLQDSGYKEEWGFAWSGYAPLFHWAKANGVRIIALNRPSELRGASTQEGLEERSEADTGYSELVERDRWTAGVITDLFAEAAAKPKSSRPKMIVLYGELHIGRTHLPAQLTKISRSTLRRPLRSVCIHQNHESLYWRVAREGRELQSEIIRMRKGSYCVLSSTPWAKLQSLVSWAEGSQASAATGLLTADPTHDEDWDAETAAPDHLSLMKNYGQLVAEFLQLSPTSFDDLTVRTIDDANFTEELENGSLSAAQRRLIRYHVLFNQKLYIPNPAIAYLATPSENSIAELASIHLLRSVTHPHPVDLDAAWLSRSGEGFYRFVLESAFGFLGSLILNPKRKCDLIDDHEIRITQLDRGAAPSYPHEKEARELSLAFLSAEFDDSHSAPILESMLKNPKLAPALFMGARYIGQALSKRLHLLLMKNEMTPEETQRIFFGNLDSEQENESSAPPAYWRYSALKKAALRLETGSSKTEHF